MRFLVAAISLALWPALTASADEPSAGVPVGFPKDRVIDPVICRADATQSSALYLPSNYDPTRAWPALFCFDPGGRGRVAVEVFREAAEHFGYVLAGSNHARNGPWADNVKAVAALVTDVGARVSLDARRLDAAGLSGGARLATGVAGSGLLQGVIACSAAFSGGVTPAKVPYVLFGTAGRDDFNYPEMARVDRELDELGSPPRVVFFAGGHEWPPPAVAAEALAWPELLGRRAAERAAANRGIGCSLAARRLTVSP